MAKNSRTEACMLCRDHEETQRLEAQHVLMRELAHGCLIQSCIPQSSLHTVADVGTGTGIWLKEVAQGLRSPKGKITELTGFDISPEQFPQDEIQGAEFIVHDVLAPFPKQYFGKFDLVNVRLLTYALKANDVRKAVEHIVQILRPGGYLQWQEVELIDSWASPETPRTTSTVTHVMSERLARGLTPALAPQLMKTMQSFSTMISEGQVSPITWTEDLIRIMNVETISTSNHPSPTVQGGKMKVVKAIAIQLLQAAISRRDLLAASVELSPLEKQKFMAEVDAIGQLLEAQSLDGG